MASIFTHIVSIQKARQYLSNCKRRDVTMTAQGNRSIKKSNFPLHPEYECMYDKKNIYMHNIVHLIYKRYLCFNYSSNKSSKNYKNIPLPYKNINCYREIDKLMCIPT